MRQMKRKFDELTFKESLLYVLAIVSLTMGFILLFFGMFIKPEGEIHESVLTAFGIILVFVGAILGIDMKYAAKTKEFKESISRYVERLDANKKPQETPVQ